MLPFGDWSTKLRKIVDFEVNLKKFHIFILFVLIGYFLGMATLFDFGYGKLILCSISISMLIFVFIKKYQDHVGDGNL